MPHADLDGIARVLVAREDPRQPLALVVLEQQDLIVERTAQAAGEREVDAVRDALADRLADVELLTADWVHWYNTDRLMHRLGRIPPIEYETIHYAANAANSEAAHQ